MKKLIMTCKIHLFMLSLSSMIHKHALSELCSDLLTTLDDHTHPRHSIYKLYTQRKQMHHLQSLVHAVDFKMHSKRQQKQLIHPQTLLVKMLKSRHSHYT